MSIYKIWLGLLITIIHVSLVIKTRDNAKL